LCLQDYSSGHYGYSDRNHRDPYPQQSVQSYPDGTDNANHHTSNHNELPATTYGQGYDDKDNEILGSGNFEVVITV
jgi:hypothetical protein